MRDRQEELHATIRSDAPSRPAPEAGVVIAAAFVLTAALTYPLVVRLDRAGRINTSDGMFSLWTVAWVAHALTTNPRALYDANIFYPQTRQQWRSRE